MGGNKTVYFTISYNLYVSHHIKVQEEIEQLPKDIKEVMLY